MERGARVVLTRKDGNRSEGTIDSIDNTNEKFTVIFSENGVVMAKTLSFSSDNFVILPSKKPKQEHKSNKNRMILMISFIMIVFGFTLFVVILNKRIKTITKFSTHLFC
jgi:uncharacterized protein YqhQ